MSFLTLVRVDDGTWRVCRIGELRARHHWPRARALRQSQPRPEREWLGSEVGWQLDQSARSTLAILRGLPCAAAPTPERRSRSHEGHQPMGLGPNDRRLSAHHL
jgi:hypothetical protein